MSDLRKTIDRMVEDAIRRILPSVMNEVLVATIARGTAEAIVEEAPPARRRQSPKKRRAPVREQKSRPVRGAAKLRQRRVDLSDLLDESAGSEFYGDPRAIATDDSNPADEPAARAALSSRIQSLPPGLQDLAEGMDLGDDEGEMWGSDEHDSAPLAPTGPEIRNINEAAKAAGVDFSRMRAVIGKTSAAKRVDPADVKANAQFEQARLQRMRERLNGGKPLE